MVPRESAEPIFSDVSTLAGTARSLFSRLASYLFSTHAGGYMRMQFSKCLISGTLRRDSLPGMSGGIRKMEQIRHNLGEHVAETEAALSQVRDHDRLVEGVVGDLLRELTW
jgi:hypothetical protein